MTCEDCSQAQEAYLAGTGGSFPVRIGRSNVIVVACAVHAKELFDRLFRGSA